MINKLVSIAAIALLAISISCASQSNVGSSNAKKYPKTASTGYSCVVDPSWLTNPSMPTKVATSAPGGGSNFCDFYQFSTQAYIYLMSMSSDGVTRNFQNSSKYPLLEFNSDGTPANSCDAAVTGNTIRSSLDKSSLSTGQAGSGATIYDQSRNVVYYQVRFNKPLCDLTSSAVEMANQGIFNFPDATTEIKLAWKVLSASEISSNTFVTQTEVIGGKSKTLGLVGMHLAIATTAHPEFVWATYEHKLNSPDCLPASIQGSTDWTFADSTCTKGLPGSADANDTCKFNQPLDNQSSKTGTPTNICRVHPYGTGSGDFKAAENLSDITEQNEQMDALFGANNAPAGLAVLVNYFNVGDLWVSDTNKSTGGLGVPNERGSLRLANTVAETDFQSVDITSDKFISNCFGCHNYIGESESINNNITSYNLSHIFRDIKIGKGESIDISTSTINKQIADNSQAQSVCSGEKGVCQNKASYLEWNGSWTNVNSGAGSVCGCKFKD